MYKLITMDIDGTLLSSKGKITTQNKIAISNAVYSGIEVVLASGRTINSTKAISKEVGANNYLIAENGAIVYEIKNDKIIYKNCMKKQKVLEIIKLCEQNSIFYTISTGNTIITKSLNYIALFYSSENLKNTQDKKIDIIITQDIEKYIEQSENEEFTKIIICDSDKVIFSRILEKMKKIKEVDVLDISHISTKHISTTTQETEIKYCYTEITNKGVNKWSAIKFLAEKLNIKDEEIITIGDNINDLEMVKNSGLGVAMENAMPKLKEIAKAITKSNNRSGIAYIINKYI